MAFDQPTRNRLAAFVAEGRAILSKEFTQQLQGDYGLNPQTGEVMPLASMQLDNARRATALLLRETLDYYLLGSQGKVGARARQDALQRIVREQAFTVLNRLCALRMAEARGLLIESVARGYQSKGFQLYDKLAGSGLGETGDAYRAYLFSLCDEFAVDLPVLFDRFSPEGRLFPGEKALLDLLAAINHPDLAALWAEDETIGWIYQYFNSQEERRQMRAESQAPRNSRELAVRNQFFTPRYVVEFLTDNTLGRTWYEMTMGRTSLVERCRYLVRRPDEVFLSKWAAEQPETLAWLEGRGSEQPGSKQPGAGRPDAFHLAHTVDGYRHLGGGPDVAWPWAEERLERLTSAAEAAGFSTQELLDMLFCLARAERFSEGIMQDYARQIEVIMAAVEERRPRAGDSASLSQEELLRQPVFIPNRAIKDPRTILLLDPACGSMHFGLYAFDLYEVIYGEAWDIEASHSVELLRPADLRPLHEIYPDKAAFLRDVPRLIVEHNIHGIDIDPRAVQIAGLSLWLRAQRSWHGQGVKPAQRPVIQRSNIVCAEPMPGDRAALQEFVAGLEPKLLGELVTIIFDKMELAGEAGSLLKIEEEIRSAVEAAQKRYQDYVLQRKKDEGYLPGLAPQRDTTLLDLMELPDAEQFWITAEDLLVAALRQYAAQAANGHSYRRRLFAKDAEQGFAFIDLCRKRYDIVLMNPPFGDTTSNVDSLLLQTVPASKKNTYIASVIIGRQRLTQLGFLGAITDSSFIHQTRYEEFREYLIDDECTSIRQLCANGWGVLDSFVETASYVIGPHVDGRAVFIDIRHADDERSETLLASCGAHSSGQFLAACKMLNTADFDSLPKRVLAFWLPSPILAAFRQFPPIDPHLVDARCGISSSDNFRFYKLWWEIDYGELSKTKKWVFLSNGGDPAPLFRQQIYVIDYQQDGRAIKTRVKDLFGSESRTVINQQYYFRAGFTYGKRTESLTVQFLPQGHVFSNEGQAIFPLDISVMWTTLAYLNTSLVAYLLNSVAGQHKEAGYVGTLPSPPDEFLRNTQIMLATEVNYQRLTRYSEMMLESQHFRWPFSGIKSPAADVISCAARELSADSVRFAETFISIDLALETSLGLGDVSSLPWEHRRWNLVSLLFGDNSATLEVLLSRDLVSYLVGLVLGRWDVRYTWSDPLVGVKSDPFAPLPTCSPGMLQNAAGLPAMPDDVPADYPLRISWPGILVDDPGHPEDVAGRVQEALAVIWPETHDAVEQEACQLLGAPSLADYLKDPSRFFADHLGRYSKSRRVAPIYWPLSTASGSYTLWLYYHRLTDQTLYRCVNDFVDPKRKEVSEQLDALRRKAGRSRDEERTLERLAALDAELADFRAELLRVAAFWKPNLNDGVQITAAPLYRLFNHRPWRKRLQETWEALEGGEYDWAHLAYSIWPERVAQKCRADKSLAIAHGLEHLYVEPEAPKAKGKRGKGKADQPAEAQDEAAQAALELGDGSDN